MTIQPIKIERDYRKALNVIEKLGSQTEDVDGRSIRVLVTLLEVY